MRETLGSLCLAFVLVSTLSCDSADPSCSKANPCIDGYACNAAGRCVPAQALAITTLSLPDGAVEEAYRVQIRATGGLPPYRWELQCAAPWLGLDEETGLLQGTPDAPTDDVEVLLLVRDASFSPGQLAQRELRLRVEGCPSGESRPCFQGEDERCLQGLELCLSGAWSDCENIHGSADPQRCGPDCAACDPARADSCADGRCACGGQAPCESPRVCCDGDCALLDNNPQHCGACGINCAEQVQNAGGVNCNYGQCDYASCRPEFYDCDDDRSNGCESPHGPDFCGSCSLHCPEMPHIRQRTCLQDGVNWLCGYDECEDGWLDCRAEQAGCDTPRSPEHCADCDDECSQWQLGALCLQFDGEGWRCGCETEAECGPNRLCCDSACSLESDTETCGSCDNDCTQLEQDRECISFTEEFFCGCHQASDCADGQNCCFNDCKDPDDPLHCGDCFHSCAGDPRGPHCVDPANLTCGCIRNSDCAIDQLCCDQTCIDQNDDNCGECNRRCEAVLGGPHCWAPLGTCYCGDADECILSVLSADTCDTSSGILSQQQCECEGSGDCAGGQTDQCCQQADGTTRACVNLDTDPDHCGGCGVVCADQLGPECILGACACQPGVDTFCAALRTADACHMSTRRCYCENFSREFLASSACTLGRYCCDGTAGGEGAPGGGADIGCCWKACGTNVAGGCVTSE